MPTDTPYIIDTIITEKRLPDEAVPVATKHLLLKNYLAGNKWGLSLVALLGLISNCASFLLTVIIGNFFMLQFQTGSSKGKLLHWLGIKLESVNAFFLLFGILLLIKFISSFYENYLSMKQGEAFVKNIRLRLFQAQMNSSVEQFGNKSFGNYLLRYSNDLKAVQNYLTKGILGGIKQSLFVGLGLFLLFKINWQLGSVLICLFGTVGVVIFALSKWQKTTIRESRDKRSSLLAFVARNFSRFSSIKKGARENIIIERFEFKSQQLYDANLTNGKMENFIQSASSFLQFAVIGFVLWLMAGHGIHVSATDGLIVVLLLMLMQGAVRSLLKIPGFLNKGRISIDKINELINP